MFSNDRFEKSRIDSVTSLPVTGSTYWTRSLSSLTSTPRTRTLPCFSGSGSSIQGGSQMVTSSGPKSSMSSSDPGSSTVSSSSGHSGSGISPSSPGSGKGMSMLPAGLPSKSGSAKSRVDPRKSMIVKNSLPCSGSSRVPRPTICLNSVIDPMLDSKTMSLIVLTLTPVVSSFDVVTSVGYCSLTAAKLSS